MSHVAKPASFALDPRRIAANAVTIAVHVVALGLLLIPMQMQAPPLADDDDVPFWDPLPVTPIELRPQPRERTPTVVQTPRTAPVPTPTTVVETPPLSVENGELPPLDIPPGDGIVRDFGDMPPVADAGPVAIESPLPRYPRMALIEGRTGEVLLRLVIEADGRVSAARIEHSSGHRDLDQEARRHVLTRWRFAARPGEGAIEALLPVTFRIDE